MKSLKQPILLLFFIFAAGLLGQDKNAPSVGIHMAALQGDATAVRQHIDAGTDLDQKDQYGSTPLIIAATFGKPEVARLLLEGGADPDITNSDGSSPLFIAAFFGRIEIVKDLLEKGADKYLRNINGSTVYDIAQSDFETDKAMYDQLGAALAPLGLKLDYGLIQKSRPEIAEMLKPGIEEINAVEFHPEELSDWQVSTPAEEDLDPAMVGELYLDASKLETIYSLLVVKNGYLIAEGYFNGGSIDQLAKRASVTKSFLSAMVGIAIDNGCLKSIDQKMIEYFPEVDSEIADPRKKTISIRQMLQMRGGYPWEETDRKYWDAIWSGSYIDKIVAFPLTKEPGTEFQYSNLTSNWLGIIVSRACQTDLRSFGDEYLFSKLNISLGGWTRDIDGYYIGSGDMEFTSRDMAKFGLLYLRGGEINGERIISKDWIDESFKSYSNDINSAGIKSSRVGRYFYDIGYGYHWWSAKVGEHRFNLAWGHGGQFIVLLKEFDMIIVVTSDSFHGKEKHFDAWKHEQATLNLIGKFIKSLPGNE